ncbi:MAG TPA: radical SAM protein [Usitatibacter sp.]
MQPALFPDHLTKRPALPTLDVQTDIKYYGTQAKSMLNTPEATGMPFWSINPYIGCAFGCTYCYARYAHAYALERAVAANPEHAQIASDAAELPPWLSFERRILVKENAAPVLRKTLRNGSARHAALIEGESITIGTATDPYQPAERRFRITRQILEVIAEHPGLRIHIITKSPLITRDVDVMTRIMRNSSLHVHVSLITVDRELARRIEPRAPTPEARLRAVRRLRESGIAVSVNVMPILPGITDGPEQLESLVARIAESGATYVGACALRLQATARKRYLPFIAQEFPELASRYHATYANAYEAGESYRDGLRQVMRRLCERYGVAYGSRVEGPMRDAWAEREAASEMLGQLELPFPADGEGVDDRRDVVLPHREGERDREVLGV